MGGEFNSCVLLKSGEGDVCMVAQKPLSFHAFLLWVHRTFCSSFTQY